VLLLTLGLWRLWADAKGSFVKVLKMVQMEDPKEKQPAVEGPNLAEIRLKICGVSVTSKNVSLCHLVLSH
jgi:hypothetical protein